MFSLPTLDANNIFQAQSDLASLAQQRQESALSDVMTGGGEETLKLLKGLDGIGTPELAFNVNARGIWDGLLQGAGNAVRNHHALRNMRQEQDRQQQRVNLAMAMDAEARRQAQEKEAAITALFGGNERLMNAWRASDGDKEGLRAIIGNVMAPTYGVYKGQGEANEALAKQPGVTQAELNAKTQQFNYIRDLVNQQTGVDIFGKVVNEGQIPANVRNVADLFGVKPQDVLDDQSRFNEASKSTSDAQKASIEAQTQPTLTQQQITGNELENKVKEANAAYANALKQADLLTAQGKLEDAARMKQNLENGANVYKDAIKLYPKMTPGQVKLFNAQMKSLGLKFHLPEKPDNKPIIKSGSVNQIYNPNTGEVTKPKVVK